MSFTVQEELIEHKIIDGQKVIKYKPQVDITLKNIITGKEYNSDAESLMDIQDSNTETKAEHVSRSVHVKVIGLPMGALSNIK
tara:strand:+ start:243 stop:491 length:249 start_codon:yes stop_codon:yes gene_type:complete